MVKKLLEKFPFVLMLFYLEMNSKSSVTADWTPLPGSNPPADMNPFRRFGPPPPPPSPLPPLNFPFKHRLYHIW